MILLYFIEYLLNKIINEEKNNVNMLTTNEK